MKHALKLLAVILLLEQIALAVRPVQIITTQKQVPNGQNGVAYSVTIKAKYGTKPYAWSVPAGALPDGLSIAPGTGVISGTPSVNDTFHFTVRVIDFNSVANDRDYTVTVSGSAPVTAVSITTTSLPGGTNAVAYSAGLQAVNGTAPYTWTIPSGALPPGISLTAGTGALAGTPTASGIYSFTARVTDNTLATYDRAFAISIAQGSPTYLFSDDFESGNFAAWTSNYGGTIATSPVHGGTKSAQFYYVICGDSTDPTCGSAHQDRNLHMDKYFPSGLSEFYLRAYVYIKTPEAGAALTHGRKIFYLWDLPTSPNDWSAVLSVVDLSSDIWPGAGPLKLTWGIQSAPIGGSSFSIDCGTSGTAISGLGCAMQYDTWYSIEVHVKNSTVLTAPFDGVTQIWVNGNSVYSVTNASLNRGLSLPIKYFLIGDQTDRTNYEVVNEYRYIDDVVINTTGPIGP